MPCTSADQTTMSATPTSTLFLRLADINVCVNYRHDRITEFCRDYIIPPCTPDITVSLTEEDCLPSSDEEASKGDEGYFEFLSLCRHLCTLMAPFGICLLHAAVIEANGVGIGFFAPSGTGKSTHIRLWRELYGKSIDIVNGDKPFVRKKGDRFFVYGSPWCGKERWQRNVCVPLHALCRLTRGSEDTCVPLKGGTASLYLLNQIYFPKKADATLAVMEQIDALINTVPLYNITCTPTKHAAKVVHDTLFKNITQKETI